jgi:hypothetical protein
MNSRLLRMIFVFAFTILFLASFHSAEGDIVFPDEGFDFPAATGPYIESPHQQHLRLWVKWSACKLPCGNFW